MTTSPAIAAVVIAHGSRSVEANDAHRATCAALATRTGRRVEPAFLELDEPSLEAAVATLVAEGTGRIDVLPFFLYPGRHMQRDIPALIAAAQASHPDVVIALGELFGADPGVIDLLADQLGDAAEDR